MRRLALGIWLLAAGPLSAADLPSVTASSALVNGNNEPSAVRHSGGIPDIPAPAELERRGAMVGRIDVAVDDVFDETDPQENRMLFRLANDLHLDTRDTTVRAQLLLRPGEPYSVQRAEETARILRDKRYLYDAVVEPTSYDAATNTVDVKVRVRDVWSLSPGIGVGRSGGENQTKARIVDENFLGRGQYLAVGYSSGVDRSGVSFDFRDQNVFQSWWGVDAGYNINSDGSIANLAVGKPFVSLDSRWGASMSAGTSDQIAPMYDLGEKTNEFRQNDDRIAIDGG